MIQEVRRLANTIWRRKLLVLACTLVGAGLTGLAAVSVRPSYTAIANIVVDQADGAQADARAAAPVDDSAVDTHIVMLNSGEALCRVARLLSERPDLVPAETAAQASTLLHRVRGALAAGLAAIKSLQPADAAPRPDECGRAPGSTPSLASLRSGLRIYQERRSKVIAVSATAHSPAQAAWVANEVVQSHVEQLWEMRRQEAARRLAWLDDQLARATATRDAGQLRLTRFRQLNGAERGDLPADLRALADARRQLSLARSDAVQADAKLERVRALEAAQADTAAIAAALGVPGGRPEEVRQARERLEADGTFDRIQVRTLEAQVTAMQEVSQREETARLALGQIEEQLAATTRAVNTLQQRRDEAAERLDLPEPGASVLALARPPARPSSLPPALLVLPGLAVFFLFGAALAVSLDRLDVCFRTERDVADTLGIACIGMVPELPAGLVARQPDPTVADIRPSFHLALRSILVTVMQLTRAERRPRIVLVTSSVPGEGKSVLATSLAMCAARLGERVLLVGLDRLGNRAMVPSLRFDDRSYPALANASAALDSVRRIPKLGCDYLSGERIGMDLLEFLVSRHGTRLFAILREHYDCVLVDGPAVLGSAEARVLASFADETLLAVRWGDTRPELAKHAVELYGRGEGAPPLHAVLTRVNLSAQASYRQGDAAEVLLRNERAWRRMARMLRPRRPAESPRGRKTGAEVPADAAGPG